MRPLWKGAISFGLVTIPVSLYPATRREELQKSIQQSQGKAKEGSMKGFLRANGLSLVLVAL